MEIGTLNKFCGYEGFMENPFQIGEWQIATDGYVLVAEYSGMHPQLKQLEYGNNRDMILKWLEVEIPDKKYSTDHLMGFLGQGGFAADPVIFSGHRVDRNKLREAFTLAENEYSFCPQVVMGGARLHFRFGKIIALVMGMREPSPDDPRYEPKLIQEKVSQ